VTHRALEDKLEKRDHLKDNDIAGGMITTKQTDIKETGWKGMDWTGASSRLW
jgi:hypothetical protein